tara:strand:+ start:8689 stop:9825 length:1137 start_codon:yes stop_codon:yes gene_type:complete
MTRWNPNSFQKEGIDKGYNKQYLSRLIEQGHLIDQNNLPVIYSLANLANQSNTKYSELHTHVSRAKPANIAYKSFTIKKRSGGKRWISIPCPPLMTVQSWIAQEILNKLNPHRSAMAYVDGMSNPLKTNATKHIGSKWLLKLDIINFFNNISEKQVYKVFENAGYPKLLSFEMARLCTRITPKRKGKRWKQELNSGRWEKYNCGAVGSLPQGAPTSPALSNLVCKDMDVELEALTRANLATYTRYADDLCFSFFESTRSEIVKFKKKVTDILWKYQFNENLDKTRIIPPGKRKILTGVVIDSGKTTIPKELRDRIRMHLYYAKKNGIPDHCKHKEFRSVIGFRNHLHGLIMYVRSINEQQGNNFLKEFNLLPWLEFEI